MPRNPFSDLAHLERRLRSLFFGQTRGGIFGAARQVPRAPAINRAVGLRSWQTIAQSPWWRGLWGESDAPRTGGFRLLDRLNPLLVRISRDAGSGAWREFAASFAEDRARELAEEIARRRVAEIVSQVRSATEDGLRDAVANFDTRRLLTASLRDDLALRLGPTAKQVKRIRRWELKQREAGLPLAKIRAGVRARTLSAVRLRADVLASDTFAEHANRSRSAVFAEDGVLVFSDNPLDDRTEPSHREQTLITRAEPTPAGQPWAPRAPLEGLPPYRQLCRCLVRRAP